MAATRFALQAALVACVVGWVLDLQRSLFGLNLYTESSSSCWAWPSAWSSAVQGKCCS
jgi:hypothetical protein